MQKFKIGNRIVFKKRATTDIKRGVFRGYNDSNLNFLYKIVIDNDSYLPSTYVYEDDFIESELKYDRGLKLKELLSRS